MTSETVPMASPSPPIESITFKTKSIYWEPNHFNNILLQNNNGPCFLISLINSLILAHELQNDTNGTDNDGWITVNNNKKKPKFSSSREDLCESPLINNTTTPQLTNDMLVPLKTLLSRPEVKLTDLLNELTTLVLILNDSQQDLTPILNKLSLLHTGLDINPSFHDGVLDTAKNPILDICNILGLKVIHGWLIGDDDEEIIKRLDDYDSLKDYQLKIFSKLKSQFEDKNLQDDTVLESLIHSTTDNELSEDLMEFRVINNFLNDNATELTNFGLQELQKTDKIISDNEVSIFFRNNHFNTIYKKQENLYLLLIDEGFSSKNKKSYDKSLVWESLTSVNGSSDVLLDGNFQPVQNNSTINPFGDLEEGKSDQKDKQFDYNDYVLDDEEEGATDKTQDELLALSLQQEEDETYAKKLQTYYNKNGEQKKKKNNKKKKTAILDKKEPSTKKESCVIM